MGQTRIPRCSDDITLLRRAAEQLYHQAQVLTAIADRLEKKDKKK